jgi:hypothetical protein
MNPKRTLARERRLAAVHEAGHVVIARRVGFKSAVAWIWPNEGPREKRSWLGRTLLQKGPQVDDVSRRMVGVAGSIAEHLWHGGWIEEYLPQEEMSESDWRLAGCVPNQPDDVLMSAIGEVGQLLARDGSEWQALIAESRRLIVDSRPSA